jgi:hypothetical protein
MKNSAAKKLKQVPAGYLVIGVDPHKNKHAAVATTEDLMVRAKFKFVNSRAGFEQALEKARTEMVKFNCRGVIFAIETGGHFWRNFAYFLEGSGCVTGGISTVARMTSGMPKWLLTYFVPVTSPKPSSLGVCMRTFAAHMVLTSGWSRRGHGLSIS